MADTISIEILAEIRDSLKSMDEFQKKAAGTFTKVEKDAEKSFKNTDKKGQSFFSSLGGGFKALGVVAAGAAVFFAGKELLSGMSDAVKAAAEQEQAFQNLANAMQRSGDFSQQALDDFGAFASQIQKTSTVSDDAVLSQLALAKSFGVSNDQAKKLIQAAVDMSAATGVDLNTAVESLGKTLSGSTGLLAKSNTELQGVSSAALKSGAAIDILAAKYAGAASGSLKTFSGSTAQLSLAFGEFQESLGDIIVKNPTVVAAIGALSKVLDEITNIIIANQKPIMDFVSSLIMIGFKAIPFVIDGVEILGKGLLMLREVVLRVALVYVSFYSTLLDFEKVRKVLAVIVEAITNYWAQLVDGLAAFLDLLAMLPGMDKYFKPIINNLKKVSTNLREVDGEATINNLREGVDELGVSLATSLDNNDALFNGFTEQTNKARSFTEQLTNSVKNFGTSATKSFAGATGSAKALAAGLQDTSKATKEADKAKKTESKDKEKADKDTSDAIAEGFRIGYDIVVGAFQQGTRLLSAIMDGQIFTELENALKSTIGAPLEALKSLDNLSTYFGDLVDQLPAAFEGLVTKLPEFIGQFVASFPQLVETFIQGFPKFIDELVKAIPVVVQQIADALPAVVNTLLEGFQKVFSSLLESAPSMLDSINEVAPRIMEVFMDAVAQLIEAAPMLIDKTIQALPRVFRAFLQGLPRIITAITQAIPQIIRSIAAVLPELVAVLADNIGPIVLALVQGILEAIPQIILVLIDEFIVKGGIFKIIGAIIAAMPDIAIALVQGIVRAAYNSTGELMNYIGGIFGKAFSGSIKMPKLDFGAAKDFLSGKLFVDKFKENAGDLKNLLSGKTFTDKLKEKFNQLLDKLKNILSAGIGGVGKGGGGGGGGFISKASGGLLSKGGTIPLYAAGGAVVMQPRGTDTVPAMLTPGEMVIPRGDVDRLSDFLDRMETGGGRGFYSSDNNSLLEKIAAIIDARPITVELSISEQQLATAVFNLRRRGYRT